MATRFALTILLAALTVMAIQLNGGIFVYLLGIATLVVFIDDIMGWTTKKIRKKWDQQLHPRLKKEYDDFDKAKPNYPKGKLVEYGKKVAEQISTEVASKEAEHYRVKGGLTAALTNASKAFFAEIDKVFKK